MLERIITENIPHGQICVAFTPDEEIGTGAQSFNVENFDADFGFTLDGDTEGEIQYENFNACKADFEITGFNVHPGSSKNAMINASLVAMEINSLLPGTETPRDTEDYEGFYHLVSVQGNVTTTKMKYFIRDFDRRSFDARAGGKIQKRTGNLPVFKERRSIYQWRKYRNIVKLQEC